MKSLFLILLIGVASVSSFFSDVDCPRCATKHPQQHFCDATFVAKVKITDEQRLNVDIPKMKRFTAELEESLKGGLTGNELQFYVPLSFCGATTPIDVGRTYVITGVQRVTDDGRQYWFHGSCDYIKLWDSMAEQQIAGFEGEYERQCRKCTIHGVYAPSSKKVIEMEDNDFEDAMTYWTTTNCFYNPMQTQYYMDRRGGSDAVKQCEDLYGICKKKGGKCAWKKTTDYLTCFKKRDDFVTVESNEFANPDEGLCDIYTNKRKRRNCRRKAREFEEQLGEVEESSIFWM